MTNVLGPNNQAVNMSTLKCLLKRLQKLEGLIDDNTEQISINRSRVDEVTRMCMKETPYKGDPRILALSSDSDTDQKESSVTPPVDQ